MKRFTDKSVNTRKNILTSAVYVVILALVTMTCTEADFNNPIDRDGDAYQCDEYFTGGCGATPPPPTTTYLLRVSANPPAGGTVSPDGTSARRHGETVIVEAAAREGHTFLGWTGAPASANVMGDVIMFNIAENVSLVANFGEVQTGNGAPTTHTLTINRSAANGGNVTVTVGDNDALNNPAALTVTANTRVVVRAIPNSNYDFVRWDGDLQSTNLLHEFYVTSDLALTAVFQAKSAQVTTYSLITNVNPSGSGSVTQVPAGTSISEGTEVSLTATALGSYTFQNWTAVSGSLPAGIDANSPNISFTMSGDVNIRANFYQSQTTKYTLTLQANPPVGGQIQISPNRVTFDPGETVTLTATAANNYTFNGWTAGTGSSLPSGINPNSASITFTMNSNVDIRANFTQVVQPSREFMLTNFDSDYPMHRLGISNYLIVWAGGVGEAALSDAQYIRNWDLFGDLIPLYEASKYVSPIVGAGRTGAAGGVQFVTPLPIAGYDPDIDEGYYPSWGVSVALTSDQIGFATQFAGTGADFNNVDSIVFYARATGGLHTFKFSVETTDTPLHGWNGHSVFIGPECALPTHCHPASPTLPSRAPHITTAWQRYSIAVKSSNDVSNSTTGGTIGNVSPAGQWGDLKQQPYYGSVYNFIPGNAANLVWAIEGQYHSGLAGSDIAIYIDDVQFIRRTGDFSHWPQPPSN